MKGWQTKTLGELCDIKHGFAFKSEFFSNEGQHVVLTPGNYYEYGGYRDRGEKQKYYSGEIPPDYIMKEGDMLVVMTEQAAGLLGSPLIVPESDRFLHNQRLGHVIPKPGVPWCTKFFFHLFNTDTVRKAIHESASGVKVRHTSPTKISEVTVSFPTTLAEQQRIVGLLDEAFEGLATAKANAEKNLQNARVLFESHLQSVFTQRGPGWVEKPFAELCDIKHGFAFKGEFFTSKGDYVVLTPGNYYESGGYRDRGEKQKYYAGEIPPDYIMKEGDMLVAMTEQAAGLLGSPLMVPESDKFLHNQRLGLVISKSGVPWTNEFFFHVFNTQAVRKAIHDSASGVKVRHTSPTKIGEVIVAFPTSLKEQKAIVAILADLQEETQRLARIYEQKILALEALKKSLLHRAFIGEL